MKGHLEKHAKELRCPLEATLCAIGGKYKTIIIFHLMIRTLRFSELQKLIPRATPKVLSQQLRELEEDGLVNRVIYPVVPPKTEYSLTEKGRSLQPMIWEMYCWGEHAFAELGRENPCTPEEIELFRRGGQWENDGYPSGNAAQD